MVQVLLMMRAMGSCCGTRVRWALGAGLLLVGCGERYALREGRDSPSTPNVFRSVTLGDEVLGNDPISVSGTVYRLQAYLAGAAAPVPGVAIEAYDAGAVMPTETGPDGAFSLSLPQNGSISFRLSKSGYQTGFTTIALGGRSAIDWPLFLSDDAFDGQLRAAYGVPEPGQVPCAAEGRCRYAVLLLRGLDESGAAVAGLGRSAFEVRYRGQSVYARGPYFLGAEGQPDPGQSETVVAPGAAPRGGWALLYVEMPDGVRRRSFEVQITQSVAGAPSLYFGPESISLYADALTVTALRSTGRGTPPPVPVYQDVDFATEVYPLFLQVAQGGLGCQGCHTDQGGASPAAGLNLYGLENAAAALDAERYPERVNVARPADSLLLTKPLSEQGRQDHPISAFADTYAPGYRLIYTWIQEGADTGRPDAPAPVSFVREVRPLLYEGYDRGGLGCRTCHVDGVNAATAPGGFYMGGTPDDLYRALTQAPATDNGQTGEPYRINKSGAPERSLLLLNPLYPSIEPHPVKLFVSVEDPRYQTLYQWIQSGYENDAP